jgi:hypothetical protein
MTLPMVETVGILPDQQAVVTIGPAAFPGLLFLAARFHMQVTVPQLIVGRWEPEVQGVAMLARAVEAGIMAVAVDMVPQLAEGLVSHREHPLPIQTGLGLTMAKLP